VASPAASERTAVAAEEALCVAAALPRLRLLAIDTDADSTAIYRAGLANVTYAPLSMPALRSAAAKPAPLALPHASPAPAWAAALLPRLPALDAHVADLAGLPALGLALATLAGRARGSPPTALAVVEDTADILAAYSAAELAFEDGILLGRGSPAALAAASMQSLALFPALTRPHSLPEAPAAHALGAQQHHSFDHMAARSRRHAGGDAALAAPAAPSSSAAPLLHLALLVCAAGAGSPGGTLWAPASWRDDIFHHIRRLGAPLPAPPVHASLLFPAPTGLAVAACPPAPALLFPSAAPRLGVRVGRVHLARSVVVASYWGSSSLQKKHLHDLEGIRITIKGVLAEDRVWPAARWRAWLVSKAREVVLVNAGSSLGQVFAYKLGIAGSRERENEEFAAQHQFDDEDYAQLQAELAEEVEIDDGDIPPPSEVDM
jgi:hypothetical protein